MTRRVSPHRLWHILIVPASVAALTSCAMQEGTQTWYSPTDGTSADAGPIAIRNVVVVSSDDGEATVVASFVNNGADDELLEVVVGDTAAPDSSALPLPSGMLTDLGPDGTARVDVANTGAEPGLSIDVTFEFANAQLTTVSTMVAEDDGIYAEAFTAQ